jgi:hypothetical protein
VADKHGASPGAAAAQGQAFIGVMADTRDCETDVLSVAATLFRRSDDPDNQNLYKAPTDTATKMTSKVQFTRGSANAYLVEAVNDATTGENSIKSYVASTGTFTAAATAGTAVVNGNPLFINGHGPYATTGTAPDYIVGSSAALGNFPTNFHAGALTTKTFLPLQKGIVANADTGVTGGSILLVDGRRYKVKSRGSGANDINGQSKITLTENYAGGGLIQRCAACLTATTKATGALTTSSIETVAKGDRLLMEGFLHEDFATTVVVGATGTSHDCSLGGTRGTVTHINGNAANFAGTAALYQAVQGAEGVIPSVVTENSANANTYQYVAQCSNRGTCDASTGLCTCYKGYSHDNCDVQNMLAM